MPFSSHTGAHWFDLYAIVDSALPAQWIGFIALGVVTVATVAAIGFVLFTDCRHTNKAS